MLQWLNPLRGREYSLPLWVSLITTMFWRRNKISKDMIPNIRPTSKAALKMQCLYSCNGNIDKATVLYDYLIKGMEDLPTYDPIQPTTMQQVKDGAMQTFDWINKNQDTILGWIDTIRSMLNKGGGGSVPPVASAPIPSINS